MSSQNLKLLENKLLELAPDKKFALAFSAGVDSTILLSAAVEAGFDVLAVTFNTNLTEKMISISGAKAFAESIGVEHVLLSVDTLSDENVSGNSKLRCYYCKKMMFEALHKCASSKGYSVLMDGTNADDLKEYRPGIKAKEECGVLSPIALCGLKKSDIRGIGEELNLGIASKPSSPCLLTRFPYDTMVTAQMLTMVETGELILKNAGFEACRLRIHNDIARIEIPTSRFEEFLSKKDKITEEIKALGIRYVTLDMQGLRSGSMDV